MRALKNTFIIGIDHGYGNIKTANTVTPTGITVYSSEPTFSGNILHYNNMYYRIGEGHKEFISDKSSDNDFYLFSLMAIAKELSKQGILTNHSIKKHGNIYKTLTGITLNRIVRRSFIRLLSILKIKILMSVKSSLLPR